jgi:hypothetical protein
MTIERSVELGCHPATRTDLVRAIRVLVRRAAGPELDITYRLDGDIARIRIPSPAMAADATPLWQHTCFEAFIAVEGSALYHEFNFAPSGECAVRAFRGYRDAVALASEIPPMRIAAGASDQRLELESCVQLESLSASHPYSALRLGLSAVVEADDGTLSYWALQHRAARPDFHDANTFTLRLEAPGRQS